MACTTSLRQPSASACLSLTLMTLNDWALASITGQDSEQYLQSQVTANIAKLTEHQHLLVAHCNAKGKMWSNLCLFRQKDGFAWIERRSVRDTQLTELKKYAVFSKVVIAPDNDRILLGVAGFKARAALTNLFNQLPNRDVQVVCCESNSTLLWFEYPAERFLLVVSAETAGRVADALGGDAQFKGSEQWLALNIEAGLPVIDAVNSALLIPQATNLQALGGISFKKGCYIGQEMVMRAKFRGINKRALWSLAGSASRVPEGGENIELQIDDEHWRRIGSVLAAVQLDDKRLLVQVVMNNNMGPDCIFRVCNDANSLLRIKPLPYLL